MVEAGDVRATAELRDVVALSCRILAHQGQAHLTFGHVSARAPGGAGLYVKTAGLGLEETAGADIAEADAEGRAVEPGVRMHDELPLHTELYAARPDVGAIVHTHPTPTVVLSLLREDFAITSQDAVPFWNRIGFYAKADLVTTAEEGRALAACVGEGRAAILRAHGLVAVGADVAEATVNAVLLDRAVRTTLAALAAGTPSGMTREDILALDERFESDRPTRIRAIWNYLVRTSEPS